ncbi:MAG: hypothetical protein KIT58_00710 [Planctomycetota bacterium]|nr:hypothetical protein [Planctomycetota bacterium]
MISSSKFRSLEDPFLDLSVIASLSYEGRSAHGARIRTRKDGAASGNELALKEDVRLNEHERIRKLLELSSRDRPAILGPGGVLGLGMPSAKELPLEVRFRRKATWELWNHGMHQLTVRQGRATLPPSSTERASRLAEFRRAHPQFPEELLEGIVASTDRVSDRGHGALVVISADAQDRAGISRCRALLSSRCCSRELVWSTCPRSTGPSWSTTPVMLMRSA